MARAHGSINAFILSVVAAFAITGTAACQNTARGVQQDAKQAEEQTRDERAIAAGKAREIGSDAARVANSASEEIAERAGGAWTTVDIKGALMADPAIDATRINVDSDYAARTVTLKGYVPTEAERVKAEGVARAKASGYTVVNNIQVRPRG